MRYAKICSRKLRLRTGSIFSAFYSCLCVWVCLIVSLSPSLSFVIPLIPSGFSFVIPSAAAVVIPLVPSGFFFVTPSAAAVVIPSGCYFVYSLSGYTPDAAVFFLQDAQKEFPPSSDVDLFPLWVGRNLEGIYSVTFLEMGQAARAMAVHFK